MDAETFYRALSARDARFDGSFFVGVTTTGIYCRPICPARTPARERCVFFQRATEAERDGFRACFRCRPELAPGGAHVDALPSLVKAALARIDRGYLNEHSVDELASELGVTTRHLRRATEAELGVSPVELAQSRRLSLAKQLLQDTQLSLTDIAFASGFSSVRRYNALFSARFGRPPSAIRRGHGAPSSARASARAARQQGGGDGANGGGEGSEGATIPLRLDYRPPFDWATLLKFLGDRAIPGVESVTDGVYRRTVRIGESSGVVSVEHDPHRGALWAHASVSLSGVLMPLRARLRDLFDLDAHPRAIVEHLGSDPLLGPLVAARPGLRVPGAFDRFETGVRAIAGQMVSVRAATTLAGRIARAFGDPLGEREGEGDRLFPTAGVLAAASIDQVASLGFPRARALALIGLARAVADGALVLDDDAGTYESKIEAFKALPGFGEWTAQYMAMRVLGWPDAFPASDLGVRKALGMAPASAVLTMAEPWRPWRAYAAMHLWTSLAQGG
ncbi:AlkA N-terminal domain-containing protein [Pendulispora albinea]|uniref:DNA-3-methyladenine glycosylase II n=1 Tax=Pendulispora albinea TaxID=2741071 RepID=A0ABZ2M501_9BACT